MAGRNQPQSGVGPHAAAEEQAVAGDFQLVTGDPLYRAQRLVGLIPARGLGIPRRILVAIALTWLPLALWAAWNRLFLPGVVEEPLLRHFGVHARFLIALPLFLASESLVELTLRRVLPQFISSGLIDASLDDAFRRLLEDARRLRDSRVALAGMVAIVALSALAGAGQPQDNHDLIWAAPVAGRDFVIAWFNYVSRPVFLLALLAWLWRLVVVARLFQRIAGLELRLAPTHPDRAGGLAFVEKLPAAFAPFFFGLSVIVAARWGHDALYHGLSVASLRVPAALLVAVSVVIGMLPLIVFARRLAGFKRQSRAAVGALLAKYGRLFERRWMRGEQVDDAGMLGAPEIGPVADTVALFEAVSRMRVVPISRATVVPLALAAALPLVPVVATQMPLKDAVFKVLMPLIGL
jgi:hypothetical protein